MPAITAPAPVRATHITLREKRVRLGVSLRAFASEMGCSFQYLHDLEMGRRAINPTLERRYRHTLATLR